MSDQAILLSDLSINDVIDKIWEKFVDEYRLSILEGA